MPPVGAVIGLCAFGVPANWIVLVAGLTVVCAFAAHAASTMSAMMQDKMRADLLRMLLMSN